MFRSIQWRITVSFILIILVSMCVLGFYLVDFVRDTQISNLRSQLESEARLVAQASLPDFLAPAKNALDTLAKTTGEQINSRVTIIASDGTVLGDSEHDPIAMENHATRPEVIEALTEGVGQHPVQHYFGATDALRCRSHNQPGNDYRHFSGGSSIDRSSE